MEVEDLTDDELVSEIVNAYEAREWGKLLPLVAEADVRGIDRKLGFTPNVDTAEDRLRRAEVELKAAKQDLGQDEDPVSIVAASLSMVQGALETEREK